MEEASPAERRETPAERIDRNWQDLLQEMRVMQTGVQLIAGFLLTLPFTQVFDGLDDYQVRLYLALVLLAGLTTAMMLSPIAVHRRLFRRQVKERLVRAGHTLVVVALGAAGCLVVGIIVLVFDVVVGRTAGLVAGGGSLLVVGGLLGLLPTLAADGARH